MRTLASITVSLVALFSASRADADFIDYAKKEINVKMVYVGPASAGLRENIDYIYARTNDQARGKLLQFSGGDGEVITYDFLPLAMGSIRGFQVRFHLFTALRKSGPASRKLALKGVDGVIFVADCDPAQAGATLAAWKELHKMIAGYGLDPKALPITVQLDHRDLPNATSVDGMRQLLGLDETRPTVEAVAAKGIGVFDALKSSTKQVLIQIKRNAEKAAPKN
jgi:hypothetical protein